MKSLKKERKKKQLIEVANTNFLDGFLNFFAQTDKTGRQTDTQTTLKKELAEEEKEQIFGQTSASKKRKKERVVVVAVEREMRRKET